MQAPFSIKATPGVLGRIGIFVGVPAAVLLLAVLITYQIATPLTTIPPVSFQPNSAHGAVLVVPLMERDGTIKWIMTMNRQISHEVGASNEHLDDIVRTELHRRGIDRRGCLAWEYLTEEDATIQAISEPDTRLLTKLAARVGSRRIGWDGSSIVYGRCRRQLSPTQNV